MDKFMRYIFIDKINALLENLCQRKKIKNEQNTVQGI